jgi:phosphoribosylformylglycinamidine synthase
MLMVLKPGHEAEAAAIFAKWELDFAEVGRITDTRHMVVHHHGRVVADLPIDPLAQASPEYDRPLQRTPPLPVLASAGLAETVDPLDDLLRLVGSPDLCSKRWVWEQYDHMVMTSTVQRPGGDAAVVRILGTSKGVAVAADCTPRYCLADPQVGGRQAVAEAWRNLTAAGARPLAVTDCLNFGNPERPEIMGQFADCIAGIGEACRALDVPVVSGNVSFYNETNGRGIPPTPTIGAVGVIADLRRMATPALKREGDVIVLVGGGGGDGWLGQSLYLREIHGREEGAPPPVDLAAERRNGDFLRRQIESGRIDTCHDIADGGLLVALAEMAVMGDLGVTLDTNPPLRGASTLAGWLFGEDQGRYLVALPPVGFGPLAAAAAKDRVAVGVIGVAGGGRLTVGTDHSISLTAVAARHGEWLPGFMAEPGGPA